MWFCWAPSSLATSHYWKKLSVRVTAYTLTTNTCTYIYSVLLHIDIRRYVSDGDGDLTLHGVHSHGSKSGQRLVLITPSRSALSFGKYGNYAKASQSTAGPNLNLNPLEHKLGAEIRRYIAITRRRSEHELLGQPAFPSRRNSDLYVLLYAQATRVIRELISSGLYLGAPGFCRPGTATICSMSWFYSVNSTST